MKNTKKAFENMAWFCIGAMASKVLSHQEWIPILAPFSICLLMSYLLSEKQ